VAYLPQYATNLAIVNLTPTPYDGLAGVVIHDQAGPVIEALAQAVLS
jgi:NAD-dependent SIR2 family protein deacetylase